MLAVHLVTVHLLAAAWTAPEVSEEEGSYASRFYRWFSESFKSCLLFLVALTGLIDTLAQLLSLKVPAMVVYEMAMNVLYTKWFHQHNIAGLISGITSIVLFKSAEASTV